MGAIADRIATMQGCSLRQIVEEIASLERAALLDVGEDDFDRFWKVWPHRVGKPVARKAFIAAVKRGNQPSAIMEGVARYIHVKPPDRPWLNPATFLNQDRFNDEPASIKPKGLAGVRAELQQEIAHGERGTGPSGDHHSNAGRLAIGSRLDDERHGRRLL